MAKRRSSEHRRRCQCRPARARPESRGSAEDSGRSPSFLAINWGRPQYLRKKKRIVLEGALVLHDDTAQAGTTALDARISLSLAPDATVRWLSRSVDVLLPGTLADALRKAAQAIPYRMRRHITLRWIRVCAASAYLSWLDGGPTDLRRALEAELAERVGHVPDNPREVAITLAALLVAHIAFPQQWSAYRLKDPLDGDPESFFRRYITPGLPTARKWNQRRRETTTTLLALRIERRFWWIASGPDPSWDAVRPSRPNS